MQVFKAADYGIEPGKNVAAQLCEMLKTIGETQGEKTLVFAPGDYFIDSDDCQTHMLYITNTVGDKEFSAGETPHENKVGLYFGQIQDLTVQGSGARFLLDGKMTNLALEQCENVAICDIELVTRHPDMHELKVTRKTLFSVDFEIDRDSIAGFSGGKLWFSGKGYRCAADGHALNARWIGLIRSHTPDKVQRVNHPLFGAYRLRDLGNNRFRAYYANTFRFKKDDCFYLFDVRRQFAGIFANACKNISLRGVKQRFNYSLAFVAQDCENVALDRVEFAPKENSPRKLASVADFMQICMCKGQVSVTNSRFEGAGDDCLNVHGIHFGIQNVQGAKMLVRFMHPQSHGFNPLHKGDKIAVINPATLLEKGTAAIVEAKLKNEYEIELTLDRAVESKAGDVIEDVTMCPDVVFANNTVNRIITRGLLLTTRGKVVIRNNYFNSNTMSGILLSDDAKNWYESGMCKDVTIEGNTFAYCGGTPVLIKPENKLHAGAVHKNIKITGNTFQKYKGACIKIKSSESIQIKNNHFGRGKALETRNCNGIQTDF